MYISSILNYNTTRIYCPQNSDRKTNRKRDKHHTDTNPSRQRNAQKETKGQTDNQAHRELEHFKME